MIPRPQTKEQHDCYRKKRTKSLKIGGFMVGSKTIARPTTQSYRQRKIQKESRKQR